VRLRPLVFLVVGGAAVTGLLVAGALHAQGVPTLAADVLGYVSAVVAGLLLGNLAVARQARLVAQLYEGLRRVAHGDLAQRFRPSAPDNLRPLAQALDDTFDQVARRMRELARDRARMEAILAGMVEGVLVVNEVGRVQLVNEAARSMLRLGETAVGSAYQDLIRHPDLATHIAHALRGEMPSGLELALSRDPGQTLIARTAPVSALGGGCAVLVLHDITDLRRADRIRRDFIANVSHELRTPLTAIRGYIEALLDAPADEPLAPEDTRRFLEIVARHSARMERLVKDLLRLARLDAGQEVLDRAPCALDAVIGGVLSELGPTLVARAQRLAIELEDQARTVTADPAKLHDILRNLVENASSYSPEGSTIEIRSRAADGAVLVQVLDQGPGIPEADLQRIFERFYRVDKARSRETGGTGLGLSIVRHLVELHGGEAQAGNRPEGGAVFTVRLPA
jgi:two-component system, OmpR family, phosphate regulon sensor histidine kinase PhoR